MEKKPWSLEQHFRAIGLLVLCVITSFGLINAKPAHAAQKKYYTEVASRSVEKSTEKSMISCAGTVVSTYSNPDTPSTAVGIIPIPYACSGFWTDRPVTVFGTKDGDLVRFYFVDLTDALPLVPANVGDLVRVQEFVPAMEFRIGKDTYVVGGDSKSSARVTSDDAFGKRMVCTTAGCSIVGGVPGFTVLDKGLYAVPGTPVTAGGYLTGIVIAQNDKGNRTLVMGAEALWNEMANAGLTGGKGFAPRQPEPQ